MTLPNYQCKALHKLIFSKYPKTLVAATFFLFIYDIMTSSTSANLVSSPKTDVPSYAILMTNSLNKKKAVENFHCANRVYLYFTWYLLKNIHEVTALWINPNEKKENEVHLRFEAKELEINNWVSLEFKNIFDDKNPIIPNLKAARMNGKWKVRVLLDGKLLETRNFNVICG